METGRSQIERIYHHFADRYDVAAKALSLIGYRESIYRGQAVDALGLQQGDVVVDIGCGTGLNLEMLYKAVGPRGRIIGVDVTDAMLDQAREKVSEHGWRNVDLVHSDARAFEFPDAVDGILSTFVLSFIPECGEVIRRGAAALKPHGRWAVVDQKVPQRGRRLTIPAYALLTSAFGITREMMERRPWEAIREALEDCLIQNEWTERYLGFVFVASGTRPSPGA